MMSDVSCPPIHISFNNLQQYLQADVLPPPAKVARTEQERAALSPRSEMSGVRTSSLPPNLEMVCVCVCVCVYLFIFTGIIGIFPQSDHIFS
jgi:hypothetical protein